MVEIALGTALAAIGAGVAIGFAGLGSHYQKLRLFTDS